jgi:rhodanese-related sulfurtransferase
MKISMPENIGSRLLMQAGGIVLIAIILGLLVNQMRHDRLPLVAEWSPDGRLASEFDQELPISLEEARALFFSHKATFLDARSPESYRLGHIRGARNLPLDGIQVHFDKVMADIPTNRTIITYCDGEGCAKSKGLALELIHAGFKNVRVLPDGWALWLGHRLPTGTSSHDSRSSNGDTS